MNKADFLTKLRSQLEGLPQADIDRSVDYYGEIIDDRIEDGITEEEAVNAVGTPQEIAEEIFKETPLVKLVKARAKPKRKLSAAEIVLIVLGSPIWLSLIIAAFTAMLSIYTVIWSVIVSLWAIAAAFAVTAVALMLLSFLGGIMNGIGTCVALLGAGFILAGLCVFIFLGCVYATKGLCLLTKKIFIGIKSCFIRKGDK